MARAAAAGNSRQVLGVLGFCVLDRAAVPARRSSTPDRAPGALAFRSLRRHLRSAATPPFVLASWNGRWSSRQERGGMAPRPVPPRCSLPQTASPKECRIPPDPWSSRPVPEIKGSSKIPLSEATIADAPSWVKTTRGPRVHNRPQRCVIANTGRGSRRSAPDAGKGASGGRQRSGAGKRNRHRAGAGWRFLG